ncbi:hypothetical protein OE88DRAFT_1807578 [Heliocybe sulcata]|uniref:DUF7770 domain-containing protein n=1 Tax=Heliocybe sulcata TaxID=5364 RepID=A0A5C3N569_9AGAM|nr:hypothetical protein OE88DRAFT_1807578 [Heliocybe sulcata]
MKNGSYALPRRKTIFPVGEIKANPNLFDAPLTSISIRGTEIPDGKVFHFILALILPADEQGRRRSITLNNSPSYTDPNNLMRGVLLVEYHKDDDVDYVDANTAPSFVMSLSPGATAASVCNYLLTEHSFEKYDFNTDGQGCRHWCATALQKLAKAAFLDSDFETRFERWETDQNAKFGSKFPMPRITGSFYD